MEITPLSKETSSGRNSPLGRVIAEKVQEEREWLKCAFDIIRIAQRFSGTVFGGFVRDVLAEMKPNDIDIHFQTESDIKSFQRALHLAGYIDNFNGLQFESTMIPANYRLFCTFVQKIGCKIPQGKPGSGTSIPVDAVIVAKSDSNKRKKDPRRICRVGIDFDVNGLHAHVPVDPTEGDILKPFLNYESLPQYRYLHLQTILDNIKNKVFEYVGMQSNERIPKYGYVPRHCCGAHSPDHVFDEKNNFWFTPFGEAINELPRGYDKIDIQILRAEKLIKRGWKLVLEPCQQMGCWMDTLVHKILNRGTNDPRYVFANLTESSPERYFSVKRYLQELNRYIDLAIRTKDSQSLMCVADLGYRSAEIAQLIARISNISCH